MTNWENILSREGVVKLLKISEATYRRYLKKGFLLKLKRKIGNEFLFDKEEILGELKKTEKL